MRTNDELFHRVVSRNIDPELVPHVLRIDAAWSELVAGRAEDLEAVWAECVAAAGAIPEDGLHEVLLGLIHHAQHVDARDDEDRGDLLVVGERLAWVLTLRSLVLSHRSPLRSRAVTLHAPDTEEMAAEILAGFRTDEPD